MLLFSLLYFVSLLFFSFPPFPRTFNRFHGSSRLMGIAHSIPLCYSVFAYLYPHYHFPCSFSLSFSGLNSPFELRLLEWSSAYFIVDLIHFILFESSDRMLLMHHLVAFAFNGTVLSVVPSARSRLSLTFSPLVLLSILRFCSSLRSRWCFIRRCDISW